MDCTIQQCICMSELGKKKKKKSPDWILLKLDGKKQQLVFHKCLS